MVISLLIGCVPQDAVISNATWTTWIAANSSGIIDEDRLPFIKLDAADEDRDPNAPDVKILECSGRSWNTPKGSWDDGYIGPLEGENGADDNIIGGACSPNDTACDEALLTEECAPIANAAYNTWLQSDGYYVFSDTVEPWRTEALMNGENDFQLTVHTALPDGENLRFHFSIAPDFQPIRCVSDINDEDKVEFVDGSDWLTRWAEDEDGYTIYYLNAGAYQANPSDTADLWFLTTDWISGFGYAKFAGEEFNSIPTSYGNYDNDPNDDFMFIENRFSPDLEDYKDQYENFTDRVFETTTDDEGTTTYSWQDELDIVATGNHVFGEEGSGFTYKTEDNFWRPVNTTNSGLDGWSELHSSWVRIKDGADFTAGGTVEGDYQILYTALESNSRMMVKGSFKVEDLRIDNYSYPEFEGLKREEYGTPFCNGATLGTP